MKNALQPAFGMIAAVVLASLCLLNSASGQTLGEYRSRQSGNWNVPGPNGTWEQWNGSAWVTENAVTSPGSVTNTGPVVESTATYQGNTTNHSVTLPSGITSGDLLIMIFRAGSAETATTPTSWTLLSSRNDNGVTYVFIRTADGSEGNTVTVTTSNSIRAAAITYRISNWDDTPEIAFENSNTNDPPSLSPSWGTSSPTLFIAAYSNRRTDNTVSVPTDYYDFMTIADGSNGNNNRPRVSSAVRMLTASSENPDAFGGTSGNDPHAATIAVKGGASTYPHPVVVGTATGIQGSNSTTHSINIPSGDNDDLLVVVFSVDGNPTVGVSSGTGWTKLGQQSNGSNVTGAIYYKMADGTDALTLSTSNSQQSTHITYRIRGATGISGTAANGNSTNSNPPSHSAAEDAFLWIATRSGDAAVVATAPPTGYGSMITQAGGADGASSNAAINILGTAAATQDPGTFTSASEQWVSWTLAILGPEPVITNVPIEYPYSGGAAFPEVAATTTSVQENNSSTSHTVSLPSGIVEDDLLLIFWTDPTNTSSTLSTPTGWTILYDDNTSNSRSRVLYRVADGMEGSSVAFTTSAGERSAHVSYRIAAGTYQGIPVSGTITTGSSTSPNPPALASGFTSTNTLWIATSHSQRSTTVSEPASYSGLVVSTNNGSAFAAFNATMAIAIRELNATSEDPATFSISTNGAWAANTIAIQGVPPTIATVRSPHTVTVTADVTVDEVTIDAGGTVVINDGITFTSPEDGTFDVDGALQMGANGTAILDGDGDFSLNSGGTLGITSAAGITASGATGNIQTASRSFSATANYAYNGSAAQATGNGLPATVNSLTIDNSAGVTLTADVNVTSTLDLTAGLLATGANSVAVATAGNINNASASSYVNGNLCRGIAAGANTYDFPIGTATAYAPVNMAFQSGTTAGTLCSSTTNGDHPDIANSDVDEDESVNRYWSFEIESGLGTANYNATFNWVNADEDMDFDFNDAIAGKYDNPNWTYPTIGTKTATSIQITGESGFSDFQVGVKRCDDISASISGTTTICSGGSANLTVTITGGTGPYEVVYTDGTNDFTVMNYTSGGNIPVSPSTTTSYTLVSIADDKDCPAATLSGSATITVEPTPIPGTLAKSPSEANVCEGTDVSATLTAGSGGNGTDELEFRTHDGVAWSSWAAYIDGDPITTWALTGVEVRTRRLGTVCPASSYVTASWTITPEPTSPDAGPFQTICFPGPATLSANTPIVGTGAWSIVSGPDLSLSQFSSTSAPNATFTPTATGSYVLRWTISNAPCTPYTADMTLTVNTCNAISGTLTWKGDGVTGVALANVALSNGDNFGPTAAAGTYSFNASGSSFTITPSKHISTGPSYTSLLNGVDVGDATSIQQHVTGINAITDFYSLVAADCNKSGTVTTADAAIVRQALLLNPASIAVLNNTKSWRFVPTEVNTGFSNGYTPPSPPYASVPVFPESRSLTGVSGAATGENFYGIKVGDVSSSANPANLIGGLQEPLLWMVEDQVLEAGETAEAVFRVSNFTDVAAFQMALGFDPQILQFEGIEVVDSGLPLTADGNFGVLRVNEGELRVAFAEALGATLPAQTLLFSVRFTALSSGEMLSELLYIDGEVMAPIAYTSELTPAEVQLVFTEAVTGVNDPALPGAQLLQNRPNPFASETGIGFVLPEACEAQLRVLDMSGRELWRITRQYGAGYHEETFRPAGKYAGGILLYELRTPSGVQTRKMVWSRL